MKPHIWLSTLPFMKPHKYILIRLSQYGSDVQSEIAISHNRTLLF